MQKRYQLVVLCILLSFGNLIYGQNNVQFSVILDADTGNEVDDYYALVATLIEPSWEVLALNATQWQTSNWSIPQSMENSYRLNQVLLGELGISVKTRRGGVARMFDWGDQAQHSAAAYEIIQQTKALPEEKKLNVIALGALTNIGSAIFIDPTIAPRIRLYWLGSTYDFEDGIYKKLDFNCVMDVQALETVLESEVEMHVIPVNIAAAMTFDFAETKEKLPQDHSLSRLLLDRWFEHLDGGRKSRTIWDLALIQAIRHPEWATTQTIMTSKDNGSRIITFYKSIDAEKMKNDFFLQVNSFLSRQ